MKIASFPRFVQKRRESRRSRHVPFRYAAHVCEAMLITGLTKSKVRFSRCRLQGNRNESYLIRLMSYCLLKTTISSFQIKWFDEVLFLYSFKWNWPSRRSKEVAHLLLFYCKEVRCGLNAKRSRNRKYLYQCCIEIDECILSPPSLIADFRDNLLKNFYARLRFYRLITTVSRPTWFRLDFSASTLKCSFIPKCCSLDLDCQSLIKCKV